MTYQKLTGLVAAAYTPMHKDGHINLRPIRDYSKFLNSNHLVGAFINGTTGEGISMTTSERKQIAVKWMIHSADDFKVIVHIGGPCLETCKELIVHANEIGAYAVGIIGPIFFKPASVPTLVEFISEIAALAPDLPVYYYHMPSISGVQLPMPEFLQLASVRIPNLAGIKFTHIDMMEFIQCRMVEDGKFDILHGYDETLLCGLALGAIGGVGSTYNFLSPVYHRLMQYFENGDMGKARHMQQLSVSLVAILNKYRGAVVCGKAIMNLMGMDFGPNRLPLLNLTITEIDQLRKDLNEINFFDMENYLSELLN